MFTEEEIQLIWDGLDALKRVETNEALTAGLIGMIFSDKEDREAEGERWKQSIREAEQRQRPLEERIIMLKAKLIQLKDRTLAQEATDFMR